MTMQIVVLLATPLLQMMMTQMTYAQASMTLISQTLQKVQHK